MEKPNGLLKVVSILMIVFSSIAIVLCLLASVLGGAVLGAATENVGIGLAVGGIMTVLLIGGCVLELVAGILGVKGAYTGCKVLGVILLIIGIIGAVSGLISAHNLGDSMISAAVSAVASLILPVLYVCGAFKGPAE